ncbi:MAG: PIN domain-containing protein [Thermoanaerobaculia bacterium]
MAGRPCRSQYEGSRERHRQRAGALRATLKRQGLRAGVADCLIAQSCIDHDLALITYDADFRHFLNAGLRLA